MLIALWLLVVLAVVGLPPVPASSVGWEGFNGVGLAGLLLLLLCCWLAPARHAGYSVHALRAHIWLSLLVLSSVSVHAAGLLLTNDVAIEYLKWRAPAYMHAGNIAFVLMVVLSLLAVKRVRRVLHVNFDGFRTLHRALSAVVVVLTGWHLLGSGYLTASAHGVASAWSQAWTPPLGPYWRGWLLATLLLLTTLLWWQQPARYRPGFAATAATARKQFGVQVVLIVLMTGAYALALHWREWGAVAAVARK